MQLKYIYMDAFCSQTHKCKIHKEEVKMDSNSRAAHEMCAFGVIYKRFKSHVLMVLIHTCYTLLYFTAEAAFNNGLNPHVMVTYRHFIGGLVMFPFAYVLERYFLL